MPESSRRSPILASIPVPIVLAPLAGGPSTPELAAAVSNAGAFGFLAGAYLQADEVADQIAATRRLTSKPFGVNVFAPVAGPADPATYESYLGRLEYWARSNGAELGSPTFSDDGYTEKLALLESERVDAVSFTFGCPEAEAIVRLHRAGAEVWVTVTNPAEATAALAAGADVLVAQGTEAGGHRGSFSDDATSTTYSLLPLIQLILAEHPEAPLVATGGIATGSGIAAVLVAGASAAQMGTAFMLCIEAGTSDAHREALASGRATRQTRAFTGRTARGIENAFLIEHDKEAPAAYPEIHYATAPLRRAARARGDASSINLWAGEAHALARAVPASQLVKTLGKEVADSTAKAAERLNRS